MHWLAYYGFLYNLTQGRKCIIFSNARSEVERNINRLKLLAEEKKEHDVFHVHHGSISTDSREYTEAQMKNSNLPLVTGATVTLELGIDLGDLERIVQTGSPHSVSSLAQRLGRSGRRGGMSQMCFVFSEVASAKATAFFKTINWQFIKCIALIELYRENWIEPLRVEQYPYSVLFHQTMSVLYSNGDTVPAALAQKILTEHTFRNISQDDFRLLLQQMVEHKMVEKTREGKLTIGKRGEQLTNHYEFFAVFETPIEYSVREGTKEVGSLYETLPIGERFLLSGKTWKVEETDNDKKIIYVKFVGGQSAVSWISPAFGETHTKVLQKMREVIVSDTRYGYLSQTAEKRLAEIRKTIYQTGAFTTEHQTDIFKISPNRYGIVPWLGSRALNALRYALSAKGIEVVDTDTDWIMLAAVVDSGAVLENVLREIKTSRIDVEDLQLPEKLPVIGKYGGFIHPVLVKKQFIDKCIDVAEMRRELAIKV